MTMAEYVFGLLRVLLYHFYTYMFCGLWYCTAASNHSGRCYIAFRNMYIYVCVVIFDLDKNAASFKLNILRKLYQI